MAPLSGDLLRSFSMLKTGIRISPLATSPAGAFRDVTKLSREEVARAVRDSLDRPEMNGEVGRPVELEGGVVKKLVVFYLGIDAHTILSVWRVTSKLLLLLLMLLILSRFGVLERVS